MSKLEQSMRDICAQHDLLNIGLDMHAACPRAASHLSVSVQWLKGEGRACAFGRGDSFADALADALQKMTAERAIECAALADEPITVAA